MVAEDFIPAHGTCVPHIHQAVHAEGEEAAAQGTSAASGATGHWLGLQGAGLAQSQAKPGHPHPWPCPAPLCLEPALPTQRALPR